MKEDKVEFSWGRIEGRGFENGERYRKIKFEEIP